MMVIFLGLDWEIANAMRLFDYIETTIAFFFNLITTVLSSILMLILFQTKVLFVPIEVKQTQTNISPKTKLQVKARFLLRIDRILNHTKTLITWL